LYRIAINYDEIILRMRGISKIKKERTNYKKSTGKRKGEKEVATKVIAEKERLEKEVESLRLQWKEEVCIKALEEEEKRKQEVEALRL
jgi:hypothetical protein